MKKLALMLLGFAATINAMAVDYTAKAVVTLQSEAGYMCELTLRQADEYGALNGADLYMDGLHVALYAINGTTPLQIAKATDLDGTKVGFMGDASTSYTLTVSSVEGAETLYLWDGDTKSYALTEGAVYNFTATANATDEDRFVIKKVPYTPVVTGYTVTPNAAGYATFSAAEATVIPTGATAYTGTISGEVLLLNQITGGYVPANTGVIVAGVASTPYNFAIYAGSVDAIGGNALQATADYETSMKNVYVLKGNAFLEYVGTNALAANKAFIQLPQSGASAPSRIRMVFNHATGVENAAVEVKAEKFIENGQVFIRRGEAVYNMQGQIVK